MDEGDEILVSDPQSKLQLILIMGKETGKLRKWMNEVLLFLPI